MIEEAKHVYVAEEVWSEPLPDDRGLQLHTAYVAVAASQQGARDAVTAHYRMSKDIEPTVIEADIVRGWEGDDDHLVMWLTPTDEQKEAGVEHPFYSISRRELLP